MIRYARKIADLWSRFPHHQQIAIVAAWSLILWITTRVLSNGSVEDQRLAFIGYTGFLMGIVVAFPLEEKAINFDPRSSTVSRKLLRYLVCVGLIMGRLLLLDEAFRAVSSDCSILGFLLRYVRCALAGIAGILLGPILFVRLRLAERLPVDSGARRPTRR